MKQRVILLTGANGDIGLAIASAFLAESPDNVVCLAVHHQREQADTLNRLHAQRCQVFTLDVCQPDDWNQAMTVILSKFGRLDVLLPQMKPKVWQRVLEVNLNGVFHGCQEVLPTMISQRSGRIINVASLSALLPPAGQTNYAAAKAGVVALTRSLAKEVARMGITVNSVCPGYIETAALSDMDEAARQAALARVPMRRFGQPEEVASAVRFLACSEAGYITGCALKIDGGIL